MHGKRSGGPVGRLRTPFTITASLLDMKRQKERSHATLTEFVLNNSEDFEADAERESRILDPIRNRNKG